MNSALHPYLDKFVIGFIDGILIYYKNEEEHTKNLATMLILLKENQLDGNISKYNLFQTKVHYLGHVVSREGITMYLVNIKAIMEWVTARSMDEVKYLRD